ncbi:MAG: hypothetical protein IKF71_02915 [Bacilli bacterium]|nr:hypothetical protein [Bacilli bacterium]
MNDENNLIQNVPTDIHQDGAVTENPSDVGFVKRKKKKDYNNRAKWKIRKEMKQQEKMLASQTEEIINENPETNPYEENQLQPEVTQVMVAENTVPVEEYCEEPVIIEEQDIVKEYIEPVANASEVVVEEPVIVSTQPETVPVETPASVPSEVPASTQPETVPVSAEVEVQPVVAPLEGELPEKVVQSNTSTYDIRRIYINFETRVAVLVTGILILFGVACYLIISTLQQYETRKVKYYENSNIHYDVCQESNSNCLKEDAVYLADKISKVKIHYHYDAQFEEDVNYKISYYILATHKIYGQYENSKPSYESEDYLTKKEKIQSSGNYAKIDVDAEVDFAKYYTFVEDYKKKYSEISSSSIDVKLFVDDGTASHNVATLSIPLSSKKFSISAENSDNVIQKFNYTSANWTKNSAINVIVGSVLVLVSLFLLIHLTRLVMALAGRKSRYHELLSFLLKEYDRSIVNAKDGFEVSPNKKIVKLYNFNELLGIHNVLNKPIVFSRINSVKSEFVIEDEEVVYKCIIKEADMGE